MDTEKNIISKIYDTLADTFDISNNSKGNLLQIAWPGEQIKTDEFRMEDGQFDLNMIAERLSEIANSAPIFNTVKFDDSGNDIDEFYYSIISSASFFSENGNNPQQKLIADALYVYEQNRRDYSKDPFIYYHLCKARPTDWYDDSAPDNWTKIEIKEEEEPNEFDTPFFKNGGASLLNSGIWRTPVTVPKNSINELIDFKIQELENSDKAQFDKFSMPGSTIPISPWPIGSEDKNYFTEYPVFCGSTLNIYKKYRSYFDQHPLDEDSFNLVKRRMNNLLFPNNFQLVEISTNAKGLSISFDYRKITIERPWLNLSMLSFPNWYIRGSKANFFSNGSAIDNDGRFPLITTSFILVRNLKFSAKWSGSDYQKLLKVGSFGPFNLAGSVRKESTINIPGMQIMAYTSKVMPPLAPLNSI
jgi:hypothetical protein